MVLYLTIIIVAMLIIALLNYFLGVVDNFWFVSMWVTIATVSQIAIDSVYATVVRWIFPKKIVSIDKKWFGAGKKEARFYEKLGIKKWKDKTLDLGEVTGFSKKKLGNATDNAYVERFIIEANYGVLVHLACILLGFPVMFICPKTLWLSVGLPVIFINVLLNTMSLMILRYNLPKLHVLHKFNKKRQVENKI